MMSAKQLLKQLELDILNDEKAEEEKRNYDWLDICEGISWASFAKSFPKHKLWFFTLLDVTSDCNRGWQQLALNLGLETEDIEWCEKYCGPSGPTCSVFAKLSSRQDCLSLRHILYHLLTLGRHDLLSRIPWKNCIEQLKRLPATKDTFSSPLREPLQSASAVARKKKAYGRSILMIFADDSKDFALRVCSQLRSSGQSRERVGVLLLSEQMHLLLSDPSAMLYKWFMQVDLFVPVLSPHLLLHFTSPASPTPSSLHHRYLFRLALDQYVANFSRNTKCRPLCSSTFSKCVFGSELVLNLGLLQVVTTCSEETDEKFKENVESFAHLLLQTGSQ